MGDPSNGINDAPLFGSRILPRSPRETIGRRKCWVCGAEIFDTVLALQAHGRIHEKRGEAIARIPNDLPYRIEYILPPSDRHEESPGDS